MEADHARATSLRHEFTRLATTCSTVDERAAAILQRFGECMPFDAGWLALRDPERQRHVPVATTGAAAPLRDYFARPEADLEVGRLGLNGPRPPMLASDIPGRLADIAAWGEHLLPAGFSQGLASGLFTAGGRQVGFLSLVSADRSRPNQADRTLVHAVATAIAENLDRTRDVGQTARVVSDAVAGVVLTRAGDVLLLPGLCDDRLLVRGSPILAAVAEELAGGGPYISFVCPVAGADARLTRVVALDLARPALDHLFAAVLLSPPGDLRGLGPTELRLLGLLVDGVTGRRDLAHALRLPGPAVGVALERSLAALGTSDRAVAAVRAVRSGLRIPPSLTSP